MFWIINRSLWEIPLSQIYDKNLQYVQSKTVTILLHLTGFQQVMCSLFIHHDLIITATQGNCYNRCSFFKKNLLQYYLLNVYIVLYLTLRYENWRQHTCHSIKSHVPVLMYTSLCVCWQHHCLTPFIITLIKSVFSLNWPLKWTLCCCINFIQCFHVIFELLFFADIFSQ